MNLQWLYYFDTIAELEHYTKAAEKLHVSQSNLSHAIKELELEVGAELFERKGRNIKLSKYGEIFHPYVKQTLNSLETGVSTLKEYIDPNIGTIVLAGFQSLAQFSTDLMVRYQSETNRLEVQFQYSQEIWTRLIEKLKNVMQTYFNRGGMELQLNIVSADTLRDAQKHPDNYRDLVVRVAGFSAYFVEVFKGCQDDLISRTEMAF